MLMRDWPSLILAGWPFRKLLLLSASLKRLKHLSASQRTSTTSSDGLRRWALSNDTSTAPSNIERDDTERRLFGDVAGEVNPERGDRCDQRQAMRGLLAAARNDDEENAMSDEEEGEEEEEEGESSREGDQGRVKEKKRKFRRLNNNAVYEEKQRKIAKRNADLKTSGAGHNEGGVHGSICDADMARILRNCMEADYNKRGVLVSTEGGAAAAAALGVKNKASCTCCQCQGSTTSTTTAITTGTHTSTVTTTTSTTIITTLGHVITTTAVTTASAAINSSTITTTTATTTTATMRPLTFLDIGSGDGRVLELAVKLFPDINVIGIEITEDRADASRTRMQLLEHEGAIKPGRSP
jgi:hypothetical protein